ncbi:SIR2 family protein [Candidatus Poribacteria bacterium]|nr:SIR2 family protein [Candidatus Poribacteria bacterium]
MTVPEELVDQIARGNGVVFVGAGLSQGAGLPGWPGLLRQMLDWSEAHGVNLADRAELEGYIENGELLLVAEEMRERLGKDDFHRFMTEIFRSPGLRPTELHEALIGIPFVAALTSNYDRLLESAYTIVNRISPHVFTHADYPELSAALRSSEFYVLNVHGTINRIETVILGQSDYRDVMHANPAYRQHLMTLFSTKTVLFIGFGLTDPDLLLLLDELRATFRDYTGRHFALMDTKNIPSIKQKRFEKDYGIQISPYTPSPSDHPEVKIFLTELAKQVKAAQAAMVPVTQTSSTPLEELAVEVRTWLQVIRYEVSEPQQRDDRTVEMLATLDEGTVKQRVLVRCIGGEITPADVDALDAVLDRKTPQGWLISDKRVSDRARIRAAEDDAFQVFNLSEFLRQMVWGPYFDELTSLVEADRIPELYVDLACHKQEVDNKGNEVGRDPYESLDAYIDNWLTERGKMHISLLGEFGTGKTWFCRHYAYRQLERYLKNPAKERMPLLITLREFIKATTAQQLINDALIEQYKLPFVGNAFEVFQEMSRRGKLLLILDGFDEMARQVDYQTVVDNFWELAKLVDENSKVILTSRTEYFRWAKESERVLGGEEFGRRIIELSPPKFEVVYLDPFSDNQIREVITKRLGAEKGPTVAEHILETENLAEMASKPVLIELALAALDEVSADMLENPAQVYLYATNKLLLRNITTERTFTSTADKLYFLCELAWERNTLLRSSLRLSWVAWLQNLRKPIARQVESRARYRLSGRISPGWRKRLVLCS